MVPVNVFYAKVVNNQRERDAAGAVLPEGRGAGNWGIAIFGQMVDESVLSNATGLLQSRNSLPNFHVHMAIVGKFVEFVGVDDVLQYFVELDAHVLVAGHGGCRSRSC